MLSLSLFCPDKPRQHERCKNIEEDAVTAVMVAKSRKRRAAVMTTAHRLTVRHLPKLIT